MAARDFKPNFYKQFQCVGPECVDSCCTHWQITIDKPTYDHMFYHSKLRSQAPQAFKRTSRGESYAVIDLDKNQRCPLLDAKGWCRVQQEDGLAHLSDTCRLYPRQALFRGGWLTEHTLLLSCPEVVRMLIEKPRWFTNTRPRLPQSETAAPGVYHRPSYYAHVQHWLLQLLSAKHRTFEDKLYLLWSGYQRICQYVGQPDNFRVHLLAIQQKNYQKQQLLLWKKQQNPERVQLFFYMRCLEVLQSNDFQALLKRSPRLSAVLNRVNALLKGSERPLNVLQQQMALGQPIYLDAIAAKGWFWKNYLLHRMYAFDFPSTSGNRFLHYFIYEFFYLRTTLILLASEGKLSDDDFNAVIQSFHKTLAHRHFEDVVDQIVRDHYQRTQHRMQPAWLISCQYKTIGAGQKEAHCALAALVD
jgi:lysine-N-methylase